MLSRSLARSLSCARALSLTHSLSFFLSLSLARALSGTELCSAAAVAMRNSVRFDKPHSPLELGTGVTTGQPVHVRLSVEVREAVGNLEAMRFTDREANLAMLEKHGNNVELTLNELLA